MVAKGEVTASRIWGFKEEFQMSRLRWAGLLLIAALSAATARGQSSGVIQGAILDPSGAAIAGAKIIAVDEGKNVTVRETTSATDGSFQLRPLLPGTYTVKVGNAGFKSLERKGLALDVNQIMDLGGLTLQIGAVTQSVTVEATVPLVEIGTGQKSYVLTNRQHRPEPGTSEWLANLRDRPLLERPASESYVVERERFRSRNTGPHKRDSAGGLR
jgi:carboxypeptidase family protein